MACPIPIPFRTLHSKWLDNRILLMGRRVRSNLLRSFARWFILENGPTTAAIISEAFNQVVHHGMSAVHVGTSLTTSKYFSIAGEQKIEGFTGLTYKVKIFSLKDTTPPELPPSTLVKWQSILMGA